MSWRFVKVLLVLAGCAFLPAALPAQIDAGNPPPAGSPDGPPEEPGGRAEGESLRFFLQDVEGRRDEAVEVVFGVEADTPLSMITWSFEFDPAVLELSTVSLNPILERLNERLPGEDHRFEWFVDDEEGLFQASLVMDFQAREGFSIPAGMRHPVSRMRFRVKPDAAPGEHPLRFTRPDGTPYPSRFGDEDHPVFNAARGHGNPFRDDDRFEETRDPTTFEDGTLYVPIIGDIGIFVRGDANLDEQVDLSDPLHILGYLFTNGEAPDCPAASDANEDSRIDISDPILLLDFLFLGKSTWVPATVYESNYSADEDGEPSACSL